ncbi:MAG: AI-2E family transporter [Chloroflexi bacterium]|nr:AI-2E family transporter [Chloroflexota bacterium]
MNKISGALRNHWQLIIVLSSLAVAFAVVYSLRDVFLPFLLGLALVYFLEPVVSWVERRFPHNGRWWVKHLQARRVPSILIVNFVIIAGFGAFAFYAFNTIIQAISILLGDATEHWLAATAVLQQWTDAIRQLVPEGVRGRLDLFVLEAGTTITEAIQANMMERVARIPSSFGALLGLAVLPIFVFYILKDREKLGNSFYSSMPPWAAFHARNIILIIQNVLGKYFRATLTLGFAVGTVTLAGLLIIGAPLAPFLAVIAGVTEMIPSVGPWLGGAIASVVTLAMAPEKLPLVIALFLTVQLIENNLLVPRIQGSFLGIHPAIAIVLLVVGGRVAGLWGLLLAVPLTATAVQLYRYARQVVQEQNSPEIKTDT